MHSITKVTLALLATLAVASRADAQQQGHAGHAGHAGQHQPAQGAHAAHGGSNEHMSGWKALDDYHMVMMGVWHPAKEAKDLKPIRARAGALAERAAALVGAAIPAACDTPANRENLAKVGKESAALAKLVASGSDADVFAALKALHDRFELVNRSCKVTAK